MVDPSIWRRLSDTTRKLVAVALVLGSIVISAVAIAPLLVTWAQVLPGDVRFEAGDRASVEIAIRGAVSDVREEMREFYGPSILWLAAALVLVSTAFAIFLLTTHGSRRRGERETVRSGGAP